MSGFSAEWLRLREPVDLAARNKSVEAAFRAALPASEIKLLDLASGAGSTVAALSPDLGPTQNWLLTDNDFGLLKVALDRFEAAPNLNVTCQTVDLSRALTTLPFQNVDGITTSAFLDLVTRPFLEDLVARVTGSGKPFLASLTYDGRASCFPADPFDEEIRIAMNSHQKTDKGFGAALGPDAAHVAESLFEKAGYRIVRGTSDWTAGPEANKFQRELIAGWVAASTDMDLPSVKLNYWHQLRLAQIKNGELHISVGHIDFAALPK